MKTKKTELPLLIVRGQQQPPLPGRDWLHSIQIDWTEIHQIQRARETDINKRFPLVFQKGVRAIRGYRADIQPLKKVQNQFLRKVAQLHMHCSHC